MPSNTPKEIISTYLDCYADFKNRVDNVRKAEVYSFQQRWGDTTCGHGGVGGQAVTSAQTYVFNVRGGSWYVYQGGRFSYRVDDPNDSFYNDLRDWSLLGEKNYDEDYEL